MLIFTLFTARWPVGSPLLVIASIKAMKAAVFAISTTNPSVSVQAVLKHHSVDVEFEETEVKYVKQRLWELILLSFRRQPVYWLSTFFYRKLMNNKLSPSSASSRLNFHLISLHSFSLTLPNKNLLKWRQRKFTVCCSGHFSQHRSCSNFDNLNCVCGFALMLPVLAIFFVVPLLFVKVGRSVASKVEWKGPTRAQTLSLNKS